MPIAKPAESVAVEGFELRVLHLPLGEIVTQRERRRSPGVLESLIGAGEVKPRGHSSAGGSAHG